MKRRAGSQQIPGDLDGAAKIGKRARRDDSRYYGQLSKIEPYGATTGDWLMQLDCLGADWFDTFPENLVGFPDWSTIALAAPVRIVQLSLPAGQLTTVLNRAFGVLDTPDDAVGRWGTLTLLSATSVPNGPPARVFAPRHTLPNPTRIATDGVELPGLALADFLPVLGSARTKLELL